MHKITALYERLSNGDERHSKDESNSIKNQKEQLEAYAKQHGFPNIRHYTDDDEPGRFFDRSGYTQMMEDVESGKVGVVMMKDMTRWGRDHVQVGIAMEIFRQQNVQFIAINHGIDSINDESLEFAPFINIMSEWYSKDCSKKIRSVFKAKGMSGKHVGSIPPYGYIKDPNDKDKWIIDEEAAAVVRRIFSLCMAGHGPYQICCALYKDKVPIPAHHQAQQGIGLWQNRAIKDPYSWGSSTVCSILEKREYCGDTVNFKTRKHLKDKKSHYVDPSQWVVFPYTIFRKIKERDYQCQPKSTAQSFAMSLTAAARSPSPNATTNAKTMPTSMAILNPTVPISTCITSGIYLPTVLPQPMSRHSTGCSKTAQSSSAG